MTNTFGYVSKPPRDYAQRTSHLYDDRDADTITSLSIPVIKTCDNNTPTYARFLVPTQRTIQIDGEVIPEIDLRIEEYVKLSDLPKDLVESIRQTIKSSGDKND